MKKHYGFTLIELIIFIIVIAIIAGNLALFMSVKSSYFPEHNMTASQLATKCAEWFIGQRKINGFNNISCGSTTPGFCTSTISGYTVSTSTDCSDSQYKDVTITVTGKGNAQLKLRLADY